MAVQDRIKPRPGSGLSTVLGGVLFCVMGILALRYGGPGGVTRVFALIFIAAGVVFGALGLSVYVGSRRSLGALRRSAVTSRATVVDRQVEVSKDRYGEREWHRCWVFFQFYASEGQVTLKARVSESFYDRVEPGATVGVRYAAADPRVAVLEGEDEYDRAWESMEGARAPAWGGRGRATAEPKALPIGQRFWVQWVLASAAGWAVGPMVRGAMGVPGGEGDVGGLVVVASGAVVGVIIGAMQWLVLQRWVRQAGLWILASATGAVLADLAVRELLIGTGILSQVWPLGWAVAAVGLGGTVGIIIGVVEWPVLGRWVRRAGWWVLVSAVGLALGDVVTDVFAPLPSYLGSMLGGAVGEGVRGLALVWLLQDPVTHKEVWR
jgi:hypothetical protein